MLESHAIEETSEWRSFSDSVRRRFSCCQLCCQPWLRALRSQLAPVHAMPLRRSTLLTPPRRVAVAACRTRRSGRTLIALAAPPTRCWRAAAWAPAWPRATTRSRTCARAPLRAVALFELLSCSRALRLTPRFASLRSLGRLHARGPDPDRCATLLTCLAHGTGLTRIHVACFTARCCRRLAQSGSCAT